MRAREWAVAATFGCPEEYGIPTLPDWEVCRHAGGGIAFLGDDECFIAAERPMRVER